VRTSERLTVCAVTLAAAVLAWALSARLGATVDSIRYLYAARSLVAGDGFVDTAGQPFVQYAPLYPLLLAGLSTLGIDLPSAARLVSALSLGASAAVGGVWVRRITGDGRAIAVGAAAAVLVAPALMTRYALSEPLFLALLLAAGLATSAAISARSAPLAALAGILTGLAGVTRWAGLPLLAAAVYVAYAWSGGWRARWSAAVWFATTAAVIAGAALVHTQSVSGAVLPATPEAGRPVSAVAREAAGGIARFVTPDRTPGPVQFVVVAAVVALVGWSVARIGRSRSAEWWRLASVPFVFGGIYVATNVLSALFANIGSLDERMLTPAQSLFGVGIAALVWTATRQTASAWSPDRRRRLARLATTGPLVLLVGLAGGALARDGVELQPATWPTPGLESPPLQRAVAAYGDDVVFSDAPFATAWATARPVQPWPVEGEDLDVVRDAAAARPTVVVWTGGEENDDHATFEAVTDGCVLTVLHRDDTGTISRVESCTPS